jgi:Mycolic acid cyclopropane synthetase
MQIIKPSDSRLITKTEVEKALFCIQQVAGLKDYQTLGGWRNIDNRMIKNIEDLRYLRLFCMNFTGFSIYHNCPSFGKNLSEIDLTNPDINWIDMTEEKQRLSFGAFFHSLKDLLIDNEIMCGNLPTGLIYQPPLILGEAGYLFDNIFISLDQTFYQQYLHFLYKADMLVDGMRIVEIGSGFGALARTITNYLKDVKYTIIDLKQSLNYSAAYLAITSKHQFNFLTPSMLNMDDEYDLVINTLSFAEMHNQELNVYAQFIKKWIGKNGALFEQNYEKVNTQCKDILGKYFKRSDLGKLSMHMRGTPTLWAN